MYTKHEVQLQRISGIKEGALKNCSHLKLMSNHRTPEAWTLGCEEGCFEYRPPIPDEPSCPRDCVYFVDRTEQLKKQQAQDKWKQRTIFLIRSAELLGTVLLGPFRWFAKLPALTQALLIAIPLIYFFPKFAESIITIVKAFK